MKKKKKATTRAGARKAGKTRDLSPLERRAGGVKGGARRSGARLAGVRKRI